MASIAFSGEIDFTGRAGFRARLAALEEAGTAIVDLSDVTYMDSSAVAELLFLRRARAQQGLSAPRVVVGPRIRRLFEIAGLQGILPLFDSVDEARAG
jgi:anti-sigma B factor antagonist